MRDFKCSVIVELCTGNDEFAETFNPNDREYLDVLENKLHEEFQEGTSFLVSSVKVKKVEIEY